MRDIVSERGVLLRVAARATAVGTTEGFADAQTGEQVGSRDPPESPCTRLARHIGSRRGAEQRVYRSVSLPAQPR